MPACVAAPDARTGPATKAEAKPGRRDRCRRGETKLRRCRSEAVRQGAAEAEANAEGEADAPLISREARNAGREPVARQSRRRARGCRRRAAADEAPEASRPHAPADEKRSELSAGVALVAPAGPWRTISRRPRARRQAHCVRRAASRYDAEDVPARTLTGVVPRVGRRTKSPRVRRPRWLRWRSARDRERQRGR